VLLDHIHRLPDDARVRLRLPHASDQAGLVALSDRLDVPVDTPRARRLLHGDPRRQVAVTAAACTSSGERVAGFAAIDVDAPPDRATILADEAALPGVRALLVAALAERLASRRSAA